MDKRIISYVRLNAFLGEKILITKDLGAMICPKLNELNGELLLYNSRLIIYLDLYEQHENDLFQQLILSENIQDFAIFAMSFFDCDKISLKNNEIIYIKTVDNNSENVVGIINNINISIFMDVIKVLHHMDDNLEYEVEDSKIAQEMMERIRKIKLEQKKIQDKISKKDGIGLLEILSSVCARHPSINPINIQNLNYYQIIEQFKRLSKIDSWEVNMNALAFGNMSSEGQNQIKHYTSKTDGQ